MVERLIRIQDVAGSIPVSSSKYSEDAGSIPAVGSIYNMPVKHLVDDASVCTRVKGDRYPQPAPILFIMFCEGIMHVYGEFIIYSE